MKKIFHIWLFAVSGSLFASVTAPTEIKLPPSVQETRMSLENGALKGHITLESLLIDESGDERGYYRINIPGFGSSGLPGKPDLPVYSRLFEILPGVSYRTEILQLDSLVVDLQSEYGDKKLIPCQSPRLRITGISKEFTEGDIETYTNRAAYKLPLIQVMYQGTMRGISMSRAVISPVKYFPVENKLVVYYNIVFKLIPDGDVPIIKKELRSSVFERSLGQVLLNTEPGVKKKLVGEEPLSMVILSDTLFRKTLQPFIRWKTEKGFRIIEAYTGSPGVGNTAEQIKSYLKDLYLSPQEGVAPPSYLLIIGEINHVPLSPGRNYITDLYYTTYDSIGDYLPELFHGRITASDTTELSTILTKLMQYETYQLPDPGYLDRSILIAGADNLYAYTHGNGQINYAASYYFNQEHGIDAIVHLHPEAAAIDKTIRNEINEGAGFINYTGHGETDGWIDPAFRTPHISSFDPFEKYGLIISNGCKTNVFTGSTDCFAEALLKADRKGVIGYIGCTSDSYWDEDFYWSVGVGPITANPEFGNTTAGFYDKLFHDSIESVSDWAPSLGEMIFAGNMAVQESSSSESMKQRYWEIYQLMGDPSLVPWLKVPGNPPVNFPAENASGATSVLVQAEQYDYCALSCNGILLDAKHANAIGEAELVFPDSLSGKEMLLVVTGDQRQPFIRTIPDRGYFTLEEISVAEESVRKDGILSNGESATLNLKLKNLSQLASLPGKLIAWSNSADLVFTGHEADLPTVAPGGYVTIQKKFSLDVGQSIADSSKVKLGFRRAGDATYNRMSSNWILHAPVMQPFSFRVDDRPSGNGNGIIEPGEKVNFTWVIKNLGSAPSGSVYGLLEHIDNEVMLEGLYFIKDKRKIEAGSFETLTATARVSEPLVAGRTKLAAMTLTDGNYSLRHEPFIDIHSHVEDFAMGRLTMYPWQSSEWDFDSNESLSAPFSLKSSNHTHNSYSEISVPLYIPTEDSVTFSFKVSSETGWDFFRFYIDSREMEKWSGNKSWQEVKFPLDSGEHLLRWRYTKDGSVSSGVDAAWIDNIIFPAAAFRNKDIAVMNMPNPADGPFLGEETVTLDVRNTGTETIHDYEIGFVVDEGEPIAAEFNEPLLPGKSITYTFDKTVNFSKVKPYAIRAWALAPGDLYPGNDSLHIQLDHYGFPDLAISYLQKDSIPGIYTDAIVEVSNTGNLPMEYLHYTYYIDDVYKKHDSAIISLDPGNALEINIRLADEGDEIEKGWHIFNLTAYPDSVPGNNSTEGEFYWNILAVENLPELHVRIYPNPAGRFINVDLIPSILLPSRLDIIDEKGRILSTRTMHAHSTSFNAQDLFPHEGIYFMHVTDHSGEIVSRVTVIAGPANR